MLAPDIGCSEVFARMRRMTSTRLLAVIGAAVIIPLAALAQGAADLPVIDSRNSTRDFDGRSVSCDLTARAGGELTVGKRVTLQIDLDSAITGGGPDEHASALLLNGMVAVALPPGLEPDGQLRLFYFDSAKGSYQFMYSKDYPKLDRLAGVQDAMQQASSGDPKTIFTGLSQISTALDPAVTPRAPADSRVIGGNASYAVSGISWLIPCNVYFSELVNPFDPVDSLDSVTKIRVNVPLKVTGTVTEARIAIYAGGLSTGVAKVDLLPSEIPATALPLAPLPEAAPATAQPGATPPPAGDTATPKSGNEARPTGSAGDGRANDGGRRTPILRPEGQDEQPPAPAPSSPAPAAAAPPPPPQKIPTLIYSYQWVSWETEIDLSRLVPAAQPQSRFPLNKSGVQLPEGGTATPAVDTLEPAQPDQAAPAEVVPEEQSATPPLVPVRPKGRDTKPSQETKPAGNAELTPQEDTQVREVKPESVTPTEQAYSVPLKEITGSGAGATDAAPGPDELAQPGGETPAENGGLPETMPATPHAAPAGMGEMVLIPEGYFLMGTGGASSAGDADELPQTKVYLPAYYIDKYPVSNRQFMEFVLSAGYKPEGKWQDYYSPATADLPVRFTSWNDATAYAQWAHKRLPTEAEWEKAARGDDGRTYPWGEDWSADIIPRGDLTYELVTAPNAVSPYGVMAMVGVLWQWTASPYAPYPFDPAAKSDKYVLRGGCYNNGRNIIRCANRYAEPPNVRFNSFSFRCVKDTP
jgi:formylglycine-generating enzyme required for sulfatase activity